MMTKPLRDRAFKDKSPMETVEHIKSLLAGFGIETEEQWVESGVPCCYSLRVNVAGTTFGSNGKGMSREFALASGYGELMERLQLGYVSRSKTQRDGIDSGNESISPEQLLSRNRGWYETLSRNLAASFDQQLSPEEIVAQYVEADGSVPSTPYYCIGTGTKEHLPTALRKTLYTTNGCAAGNTMEEALVQAISEIVERHHQLRIISENITPPSIPEDTLRSCEAAYGIITFLRSNGYKVVIKDCSLGGQFPVVCACIIDQSTGEYHTHFGAYPIFEIALERTLTESFQGKNLGSLTKFSDFLYKKNGALALDNLVAELTKGVSKKAPAFFADTPSGDCPRDIGFTGKNNRELLRQCVEFFTRQHLDILVRDCSCLGFPTYQVVIPGYSEIFLHRLAPKHNDQRFAVYAERALRNPSAARMEDILGLLKHLTQMNQLGHNISNVHGFLACANLPAALTSGENAFLMAASLAHVNYTLGRYGVSADHVGHMLRAEAGTDREYLICLKRYLSLLANGFDKEEIRAAMDFFHRPETVDRLYAEVQRGNPLDPFTLHCGSLCDKTCPLFRRCFKRRVDELSQLVSARTMALDFNAMARQMESLLKP